MNAIFRSQVSNKGAIGCHLGIQMWFDHLTLAFQANRTDSTLVQHSSELSKKTGLCPVFLKLSLFYRVLQTTKFGVPST